MPLISLHDMKKSYGDQVLLDIDHLAIHKGDRIGLVGSNGSGKTTLLRILAGDLDPDHGSVYKETSVSVLPQLKQTSENKSGGEVTADYIIDSLNQTTELLLADEPTTHLDMSHIEWVEKAFQQFQGSFVVISHDRNFLDRVCQTIWELDDKKIVPYSGNYTTYKQEKEKEKQHQQTEYEKYIKKSKQLVEAKEKKAKQAEDMLKVKHIQGGKVVYTESSSDFYQAKAKKLHRVQKSMESRLERLEKVDKPKEIEQVKMSLPNMDRIHKQFIIRGFNIEGEVPNKLLWKPATITVKGGEKIGLLGPNGSGKTTLIRKIINENETFTLSPAMKIGYFSQDLSVLDTEKTVLENVSEDSVQTETLIRIILGQLKFKGNDVYKKVSVLSGGERVKVSLAKLLAGNYNTLILDEPTNFLDIQAVEALETLLKQYDGTIILISHDRSFVSAIVEKLWILENEELLEFTGSYSEWEQREIKASMTNSEEELMRLENDIVKILSELSLSPSEEKDKQFQRLLEKKRALQKK